MAHDAVLQVRMDSQLKSEVEQLYRQMGTTFPEAVRLFARQSVMKRRLPFDVCECDGGEIGHAQGAAPAFHRAMGGGATAAESGFAMLSKYACEEGRAREKAAWREAVVVGYAAVQAELLFEQGDA